ncbi:uncharacterized protein [Penaeus vannamei]|uniref:uncharacterized protein n=1 Tax=Penaeus vannamei TaxID=6689 RepID=UPI00387F6E12
MTMGLSQGGRSSAVFFFFFFFSFLFSFFLSFCQTSISLHMVLCGEAFPYVCIRHFLGVFATYTPGKLSHGQIYTTPAMELLTTSRGGRKLLYEGYAYTKQRTHESTVRWECSRKKTAMCRGSLITDADVSRVQAVSDHTHAADAVAMTALKVRREIMDTAEVSGGRPGQILADKLATCPQEVLAALGKKESLKRQIRRARRGAATPDLRAMEGAPHPLPRRHCTERSESATPFVRFDDGAKDSRLAFPAGGDDGLELLRAARGWLAGGTRAAGTRPLLCVRDPLPQPATALGRHQPFAEG